MTDKIIISAIGLQIMLTASIGLDVVGGLLYVVMLGVGLFFTITPLAILIEERSK